MLNITNRISLSSFAKRKVRDFLRQQPAGLDTSSWDRISSKVKNELSKKLVYNQKNKCVYCERDLVDIGPEIDHFAHKGLYPEFTFTTTNLFYSCHFCNSGDRKGQKPTIDTINVYYHQCVFKIVHPLFNNPNTEIIFRDEDRVDLDWDNCTDLGKETIKFFGFDDEVYTLIRSKNHILGVFDSSLKKDDAKLISRSITYKSKRIKK